MSRRLGILLLVLWAFPALGQTAAARRSAPAPAPCTAPPEADRLARVTPEGELLLNSGRTVRLAGLRLPEDTEGRDRALARLRDGLGQAVSLRAGASNRWSRHPALVTLGEGAAAVDLARALIGEGWALVDFAGDEIPCRADLLVDEAEARRRELGLWARDRYRSLAAADLAGLRARIGRFVLVEGRVRSVGERGPRTYLNFGGAWAQDFTVTIPKRIWTTLAARGISTAALTGRRIRVRGLLEDWNGPSLEVQAAEAIEILEREPTRR